MEIWKKIAELSDRYEVSDLGNIRKVFEVLVRSNGRQHTCLPKNLRPTENGKGYLKVRCRISQGVVKNVIIHTTVARYFCDGRLPGLQVNHVNGDKSDNRAANLEWVTSKENIRHAWNSGLSTSEATSTPVAIDGIAFGSMRDAASFLGIDRNTIAKATKSGVFKRPTISVKYKGVDYPSIKDAARKNNLNPKTIQKYCDSQHREEFLVSAL